MAEAGAQVVSTILYDGKPEYFAIMVTHPESGIRTPADLKGRTFAFGDKGSTSGYLIPWHYFMTQGINPDTYFSKVLYTRHQAIETQVAAGQLDAGADYNRNRTAMIEQGLLKAERSKIIWQSAPLPNDAFAVSKTLFQNKALVAQLQQEIARLYQQPELRDKLRERTGQSVVIVNRPGAGATLGAAYVSKANPDGYSIAGPCEKDPR